METEIKQLKDLELKDLMVILKTINILPLNLKDYKPFIIILTLKLKNYDFRRKF